MDYKRVIKVFNNKAESVAQSAGDNIVMGLIIANLFIDIPNKITVIVVGIISALVLYGVSIYFGVINSKK